MDDTTALFFYGTLIHPKILIHVIRNTGSHLKLCPAILFDFTRHRISYVDYPGIIPYTKSEKLFKRELNREEKSVRGMLVTGLTKDDMARLDFFEGGEYVRRQVSVHPLEEFRDISAHCSVDKEILSEHTPLPFPEELLAPLAAEAYIYCEEELEAKLWSYEDFVEESARRWY